jgi:glycosyltransferase involved in cell wall biosynthesis
VRGIPTVANRLDGVVDAVLPGRTGLLVEAGDPAAMAEAIGSILDRSALADRPAIALEAGQRWSRDRLARDYGALIREVAEHGPP